MEFFSNSQLSENNIYIPANTYEYNMTYPISNTFGQSSAYTGANIEKNYTHSYQKYISNIKTTISNTDYNSSYDYNNIDSNEFANYEKYFQNENYQSEIAKNPKQIIYQQNDINNFTNMKVLPTKYLPPKILKEGEIYNDNIDYATVIPLKENYKTENNFISPQIKTEINEYYKSTPEISYSNQQYDFTNYENKIEPQTYNYELNTEENINSINTINDINAINTTDINTENIYPVNNVIENEPVVNLPQENYEINAVEEINKNTISSNDNQPINSPEIYQEQVIIDNRHSYIHKSPEINYRLNNLLSPLQSPFEKYETQSYNAEDNFDINEMLRLREENELYKKQLLELDKYKAEAAQIKELREQVEQLSPLVEKVAEMDLLKTQLKELNQLRAKVSQLEALKEQIENNNQKTKLQSGVQEQENTKIEKTEIKEEKQIIEKKENTKENIEPEQEPEEMEVADSNSEPKEDEQEVENKDPNIEHVEEQEEHQEKEIKDSNSEPKEPEEQEEPEQEDRDSNIEHENEEEHEKHQEIENRDSNIELKQDSKEIENRESNIEDLDDISHQSYIRGEIIHNTEELEMIVRKINKESSKITLNLLYKASADSDRAKAFHKKCDKAKSTLVLIETDKKKRFGGYTSVNWQGKSIEKKDENAFIFSLDNMKTYGIIPEEKAIGCYPKFGPVFLGCQIRIYDHAFKNGGTTWEKGLNYNTDDDFVLTGGERVFNVKEIEVYEVIMQ